MNKKAGFLFACFMIILLLTGPFAKQAEVECKQSGNLYFFAFNKAMIRDDRKLQQRGVTAINRISDAVNQINQAKVEAIIEPVLTLRDYLRNPVEMKVSQKIILSKLHDYSVNLDQQDTFILYSHTHGVKNNFTFNEPWGGIRLDNGYDLPHKGVTIWPDYADTILQIPAKTVVILTMSCYSGGFVDYLDQVKDQWMNRKQKGRNFLIITSQNNALQSGPVIIKGETINPFTYAVEKAFKGEADGYLNGERDQSTTIEEFLGYVTETTHSVCSNAFPQFIGSYDPGEILFSIITDN